MCMCCYSFNSFQIDIYRTCNLPALHAGLKIQFTLVVEGEYLAIYLSVTYPAIPTMHEIHLCFVTQGHFCVLNNTLYPLEKIQ